METKKNKNKLKSFGKNRRERKAPQENWSKENGEWSGSPRQEELRQRENPLFTRYYKELQQLGRTSSMPCTLHSAPVDNPSLSSSTLSCDEAWEREMALFRQPLPTTFWINDTDPLAEGVGRYFAECVKEGLVEPIPWYPIQGMGWRILADKTSFRKREEMKHLRQFLIQQTALGLISRQEEVSMIPPFLLDIQPTDVCLDMCASPGSKTAQMLVSLGRHKKQQQQEQRKGEGGSTNDGPKDKRRNGFPYDYLSEGLVVANELDTKRANMLVHQVKRLRLLFPFALFTNHDARYFPDVVLSSSSSPSSRGTGGMDKKKGEEEGEARAGREDGKSPDPTAPPLRFDKILCDVVCSGDGTLRKAPHIFRIWTPWEAMFLQRTQIQIALRAAHLLKIGGRLVYSTCSLNPIENEAVVTQIVHRTNGAMKLVNAHSTLLPNLPCAPGMTHWVVTDAKGEVVAQPIGNMHEALFPPHTPGGYTSSAVDALDLSQCLRLFPSHCAGGGFFVAVLDKVQEFRIQKRDLTEFNEDEGKEVDEEVKHSQKVQEEKGEEEENEKRTPKKSKLETVEALQGQKEKREKPKQEDDCVHSYPNSSCPSCPTLEESREQGREKKIRVAAPPQFLPAPQHFREEIQTFYEMPQFPMENVVIRAATGERELRITQGSVGSFVSDTALRILTRKTDKLLVVASGLRVFAHESLSKRWRIAYEAAPLFEPFLSHSSRFLRVSTEFIQKLLQQGKGNYKMMHFDTMKKEDGKIAERLEHMDIGPVFLAIDSIGRPEPSLGLSPIGFGPSPGSVVCAVGLRARSGLQLQVDHEDMEGFRLRLGLSDASAGDEKQ